MTASNTVLNPTIIANEALMLLDNNLVLGNQVYRGYEAEFNKTHNGYKPGAAVTIRKPARYTVRDGATMSTQDTTEGSTTVTVNKQKGIDLEFSSQDMTLKIGEFRDRFLKSAMIQLANQVDTDVAALYKKVWNWVGTPTSPVNSFADFALAPQRLEEMAVPTGDLRGVLSPADKWGMLGSFTGLYINDTAKTALEKAKLPMIAGVDVYGTQNVATHTTGTRDDTTPLTRGAQSATYAATKDTGYFDLATDGWDTVATIAAGDVFTIAGVYAVNPVTKARQTYLQQFVVVTAVTADATTSNQTTVRISPPPIFSGAYQNVYSATSDTGNDQAIVNVGTASTGYKQNLVFDPKAFSLVMVPMESPEGAAKVTRQSYKGLSVRLIPIYDGLNDVGKWRLDILYGVDAIYPDLACRLSGTT